MNLHKDSVEFFIKEIDNKLKLIDELNNSDEDICDEKRQQIECEILGLIGRLKAESKTSLNLEEKYKELLLGLIKEIRKK